MPPTYRPAETGTGGFFWDPFGEFSYVPQQNIDPKTGKPYPYINPATGQPRPVTPPTQANLATNANLERVRNDATQSEGLIQQLLGAQNRARGSADYANQLDQFALGGLAAGQAGLSQRYNDIASNQRGLANTATQAGAGLLGALGSEYGNYTNQANSALSDYLGATQQFMTPMRATGSSAADVQRQLAAYGQAAGIAGGSLDYQAALSQAVLAPQAVQVQAAQAQAVLAQLTTARAVLAQTAQYSSDRADIDRQLKALDAIEKDIRAGGAEQKAALEKFKGLSDPEVTAKERFMSEVARREFEAGDKSSRDAVSQNLAMRGLRSGGQQIAMQQAARQQLSQDRLLKELGIQAGAVDRSMQALQGWGTMANAIRASDQTALGLQSGQANAIRDMNDRVGMFNTAENNTTNRFNAGLATQTNQFNAQQANNISMHNSSVQTQNNQFNAAQRNQVNMFNAGEVNATNRYNAGLQTQNNQFNAGQINNAYANNQATRLSGASLQASQSNAIRSANDSMAQFTDLFNQSEASRVSGLAGQRAGMQAATRAENQGRTDNFYGAGTNFINSAYGWGSDANQAGWNAADKDSGFLTDSYNALLGTGDRAFGRDMSLVGSQAGITSGVTGVRAQNSDAIIRALGLGLQAENELKNKMYYGL